MMDRLTLSYSDRCNRLCRPVESRIRSDALKAPSANFCFRTPPGIFNHHFSNQPTEMSSSMLRCLKRASRFTPQLKYSTVADAKPPCQVRLPKFNFLGKGENEVGDLILKEYPKFKPFQVKQIFNWIYSKGNVLGAQKRRWRKFHALSDLKWQNILLIPDEVSKLNFMNTLFPISDLFPGRFRSKALYINQPVYKPLSKNKA